MVEIETNEPAAIVYATYLRTYKSCGVKWNLARAALRWREELEEALVDRDSWRAELAKATRRIAELEAERDDALKRAEEAEGKLRAMESRMERIRLALLASMSDEQLAEARHE